ncbi:HlyD family efflux transporter periplasmic adaptor subunit [Chamaesiphon sp. GL140_3_metabinner_50]|uniref:HlyD family secretion protein n=1 Tax=Chamaesiphon sp. GL140_3_metabinner_50 TaxID=2970812 RepID=UPI0025F2F247|nr:HlyD family efflux transporter periplasmic adaptor subunit [Chamaesiphon sp. GL140_3_metabinner_50]
MDNQNFSSGEMIPANINNNGHHLVTIAPEISSDLSSAIGQSPHFANEPETSPDISSAIVPFTKTSGAIVQLNTSEEYLPAIGRGVSAIGLFLVASFGAAIALSGILKYKITIQAPATIRPVGELRLVQSTIEGSILSIAVRENQTVRAGDPIATVKDFRLESKLQTKRRQLVGDIQKAKYQISALDSQISALDRQGTAEIEQTARSISGIQSELTRAERDYRDKNITTQTEVAEAQANWRTAQKEQQAAEAELQVTAANIRSVRAGYQSALARSQRYQSAATEGAISTNQLEEAQLAAEQQSQSIAAQSATLVKQRQIVARIAETVTATAARVKRTQTALNPSQSESQTIVQKIARERATGKAAIARLQQERQKLFLQRNEIVDRIAINDREIAQIATELQPTIVRAPISGTIQELNLRNNSQVVHAGDRIAQIMPTDTLLSIKALVAIADIDNVKVGQTVQLRISACPYTDYGVGTGKISEVAADVKPIAQNAAQQPQTAANGVYEVTIKPDTLTLDRGSKKCQIRAGLTARADIISKEETILHFMLSKARLLVE